MLRRSPPTTLLNAELTHERLWVLVHVLGFTYMEIVGLLETRYRHPHVLRSMIGEQAEAWRLELSTDESRRRNRSLLVTLADRLGGATTIFNRFIEAHAPHYRVSILAPDTWGAASDSQLYFLEEAIGQHLPSEVKAGRFTWLEVVDSLLPGIPPQRRLEGFTTSEASGTLGSWAACFGALHAASTIPSHASRLDRAASYRRGSSENT